jgi:hypothetical protein
MIITTYSSELIEEGDGSPFASASTRLHAWNRKGQVDTLEILVVKPKNPSQDPKSGLYRTLLASLRSRVTAGSW